ncbi:hypothetical protein GW17_00031207 [Ensete ventricosum]|nr:hypothetical protein GW17_00031207 [Ensete ventricosum]
MVYPCSGTSSSSTTPFPFLAEVLMVLPEASADCWGAAFHRRFLIPAPSPVLGRFLAVDAPTSTTADALAADGATDPLPTPPPDFILPRLNISVQRKVERIPRRISTSSVSSVESAGIEFSISPLKYKRALSLAQGLSVLSIYKRALSLAQGLSVLSISKRALSLAQGLLVLSIYKRALSLAQELSVPSISK